MQDTRRPENDPARPNSSCLSGAAYFLSLFACVQIVPCGSGTRRCHLFNFFASNSSTTESSCAFGGQSSFDHLHGLTAKTCADTFAAEISALRPAGDQFNKFPANIFLTGLAGLDAACPYLQFEAGITPDLAVVSIL